MFLCAHRLTTPHNSLTGKFDIRHRHQQWGSDGRTFSSIEARIKFVGSAVIHSFATLADTAISLGAIVTVIPLFRLGLGPLAELINSIGLFIISLLALVVSIPAALFNCNYNCLSREFFPDIDHSRSFLRLTASPKPPLTQNVVNIEIEEEHKNVEIEGEHKVAALEQEASRKIDLERDLQAQAILKAESDARALVVVREARRSFIQDKRLQVVAELAEKENQRASSRKELFEFLSSIPDPEFHRWATSINDSDINVTPLPWKLVAFIEKSTANFSNEQSEQLRKIIELMLKSDVTCFDRILKAILNSKCQFPSSDEPKWRQLSASLFELDSLQVAWNQNRIVPQLKNFIRYDFKKYLEGVDGSQNTELMLAIDKMFYSPVILAEMINYGSNPFAVKAGNITAFNIAENARLSGSIGVTLEKIHFLAAFENVIPDTIAGQRVHPQRVREAAIELVIQHNYSHALKLLLDLPLSFLQTREEGFSWLEAQFMKILDRDQYSLETLEIINILVNFGYRIYGSIRPDEIERTWNTMINAKIKNLQETIKIHAVSEEEQKNSGESRNGEMEKLLEILKSARVQQVTAAVDSILKPTDFGIPSPPPGISELVVDYLDT